MIDLIKHEVRHPKYGVIDVILVRRDETRTGLIRLRRLAVRRWLKQ